MATSSTFKPTAEIVAKTSAITKALAKETGVKAEDVQKILSRLGIEKSLSKCSPAAASKVNLNDLRIATSCVIL